MIDAIKTAPPVSAGRPIPNFPLLTEALGGLRGITVVGGPTKHGKSRLVANLVANLGGPALPVLYLDCENDDQIDESGAPITRQVGDWIVEAYGQSCAALDTLYGYHSFVDLKSDLPTFTPPACIVIDTVQAVVGQAGERMRTEMVALVEWAKERVRHGYLVVLVSQVNGFGEFKESKALAEGGWSALMIQKKGNAIEVRVGHVRHAALETRGVLMQMDGARISEVRKLGTTLQGERGERLTRVQRAVVKVGQPAETPDIIKALGLSLNVSSQRRKGERWIAAAFGNGEIRLAVGARRGSYVLGSTDIPTDTMSSAHVGMSVAGSSREGEVKCA